MQPLRGNHGWAGWDDIFKVFSEEINSSTSNKQVSKYLKLGNKYFS